MKQDFFCTHVLNFQEFIMLISHFLWHSVLFLEWIPLMSLKNINDVLLFSISSSYI
jgi:hypothetical protein